MIASRLEARFRSEVEQDMRETYRKVAEEYLSTGLGNPPSLSLLNP